MAHRVLNRIAVVVVLPQPQKTTVFELQVELVLSLWGSGDELPGVHHPAQQRDIIWQLLGCDLPTAQIQSKRPTQPTRDAAIFCGMVQKRSSIPALTAESFRPMAS